MEALQDRALFINPQVQPVLTHITFELFNICELQYFVCLRFECMSFCYLCSMTVVCVCELFWVERAD
jgi:hypothetical protein